MVSSHAALAYADGDPEKASQLAETYRHIARNEYLGGQPPLDPHLTAQKIFCAHCSPRLSDGYHHKQKPHWLR